MRTSLFALALAACGARGTTPSTSPTPSSTSDAVEPAQAAPQGQPAAPPLEAGQAEAIFAGGCFWCIESEFDDHPGVLRAVSGYTGGKERNPTYKAVGYGQTSHLEAVRVVYDPSKTDYATLLDVFWHNIDPTQGDGQFCDRGEQYRTAVFVTDADQRALAKTSKGKVASHLGKTVDTRILDAATFWVAEDYHQDFHVHNPSHYKRYRVGCGRDARLLELWGEAPVSVVPR